MRRLDPDETLWFVLLLGYGLYMTFLLVSGDVRYFMHPRMFPFIAAAAGVFFLLAAVQTSCLFRSSDADRRRGRLWFVLFALPLLLGMTVAPRGMHEETAMRKGMAYSGARGEIASFLDPPEKRIGSPSMGGNGLMETGASDILGDSDFDPDGFFTVDPMHFDRKLRLLEESLSSLTGRKGRISGFVQRRDTLPAERFFVARMLMVCCAADALVTGLLVEWPEGVALEPGAWVEAEGVLGSTEFFDDWLGRDVTVPFLKAERVVPIAKPANIYVYPSLPRSILD
jgi:putative membrane protein